MKARCFLIITLLYSKCLIAQSWGDSSLIDENVFYSVEEAPKFIGGSKALYKFISENLRYPKGCKSIYSNKVVNAVLLINKDGNVTYAKIEKGINICFNTEVIEMIQKMPRWIPAKQNGLPVKYYQNLPIFFVEDR